MIIRTGRRSFLCECVCVCVCVFLYVKETFNRRVKLYFFKEKRGITARKILAINFLETVLSYCISKITIRDIRRLAYFENAACNIYDFVYVCVCVCVCVVN